jgi:hypothetical protein
MIAYMLICVPEPSKALTSLARPSGTTGVPGLWPMVQGPGADAVLLPFSPWRAPHLAVPPGLAGRTTGLASCMPPVPWGGARPMPGATPPPPRPAAPGPWAPRPGGGPAPWSPGRAERLSGGSRWSRATAPPGAAWDAVPGRHQVLFSCTSERADAALLRGWAALVTRSGAPRGWSNANT